MGYVINAPELRIEFRKKFKGVERSVTPAPVTTGDVGRLRRFRL
jgi:hypothetical protein